MARGGCSLPTRRGRNLGRSLIPKTAYLLPDELRSEFAKDFGPLIQSTDLLNHVGPNDFLVAVGDIVSVTAKSMGLAPRIFVCDYKTKRGEQDSELVAQLSNWGDREIRVQNPAAGVTREAWQAVRNAVPLPGITRIVVDGEEDLLGLPAFMEAPLGAKVLYGAPGRGMILVTVDEEFRESVAHILTRMTQP